MSSKDYIYCYQGSALRVGSGNVVVGKVFDPYDPSTIDPFTIRCRFSQGYTPTMGDRQTLVVDSENIWDVTYNDAGWYQLFLSNSDLIEVLASNTANVGNMQTMFQGCSSLTSISNFDTSHVSNMNAMFDGCTSLTTVPLFDTSHVTNMSVMFRSCTSLTTVPLFDTSSCTDMGSMFTYCSSLITIPLFDTRLVGTLTSTFWGCTNVESGALALYQQASSQTNVPQHSWSTFYQCGINTESGRAERAQIPASWGGDGA